MSEKIQKLIKPFVFLAIIVFVICCIVRKPAEFGDVTSYIGYSVTAVTLFFIAYEKWIWKFIPCNKPSVLNEKYTGCIRYLFNGVAGEKEINVTIKQSWLNIDVKTMTDINSSVTISSTIVKEYGENVLYYTYMTNPTAATQKENPIQHGTCRMVLAGDNKKIRGKYWTSSNTTGDMEWIAEEK